MRGSRADGAAGDAVRPSLLALLLHWDHRLSWTLASVRHHLAISAFGHPLDIRSACLLLEWALHGVPWIAGSAALCLYVFLANWPPMCIQRAFLLLLGLLVDLAVVGLIKISIRRNRPAYYRDDQVYEAPVADKYSFPSGHASRASMLSTLGVLIAFMDNDNIILSSCHYLPVLVTILFLISFPPLLATSRVVMGRHFVSDAVAGLLLGFIEGCFVLRITSSLYKMSLTVLL